MSIIGFGQLINESIDFELQDLTGNVATQSLTTTLRGNVTVTVSGRGVPEGDEYIHVKQAGETLLSMTGLDSTPQVFTVTLGLTSQLEVEFISGNSGNTQEFWDVNISQVLEQYATSAVQLGQYVNRNLWTLYFNGTTSEQAAALSTLQELGWLELEQTTPDPPAWAVNIVNTHVVSAGKILRTIAYTEDLVLKAEQEATALANAQESKEADLLLWATSLDALEQVTGFAQLQTRITDTRAAIAAATTAAEADLVAIPTIP